MRRASVAAALGALCVVSVAAADSPAQRQGRDARPRTLPSSILSALPSAQLTTPRSAYGMPKTIPPGEKLDGFFVEVPAHFAQMKEPPHYVQLWASQADRDARSQGQVDPAPTCFMNAYPSGGGEVNWAGTLNTTTTVQNYSRSHGSAMYGNVQIVRSERVKSETQGRLTYEITFAYVDAVTQGVRLQSRQTLEMSLVRELPGKVKVWGTQGEGEVMFLVRRERHEKERFSFGPLVVNVNGSHASSASDGCPATFMLSSRKGVAASAVIQVETLLSIEDVPRDDDGAFQTGFGILQRESPQAFGQREAKIRPMRIGVSSTWMSQDEKPVLSISHGWSGRERTQAI